uniref:Uncharacterized protein n=1 Tax=Arundo donax TaxID=35708 RepID=A0A0A8YPK2_ARUDO
MGNMLGAHCCTKASASPWQDTTVNPSPSILKLARICMITSGAYTIPEVHNFVCVTQQYTS